VGGGGLGPRGPLPYAYTRLRRRDALTAGLEDTSIVTNEGSVRQVAPLAGATVHATLVPEIVPQPPDLTYPVLWDNDAPLLVTNRFGAGRTAHLAGGTDRLNVTSGPPDHQRLLENALAWALAGDAGDAGAPGGPGASGGQLVETDAPPDLHVTLLRRRADGALYLHLVSY